MKKVRIWWETCYIHLLAAKINWKRGSLSIGSAMTKQSSGIKDHGYIFPISWFWLKNSQISRPLGVLILPFFSFRKQMISLSHVSVFSCFCAKWWCSTLAQRGSRKGFSMYGTGSVQFRIIFPSFADNISMEHCDLPFWAGRSNQSFSSKNSNHPSYCQS